MNRTSGYGFGSFWLLPEQRQLLERGRSVKLGSRAFDLLVVLVEERHGVVGKQQLLDRVWPGLVVEEANIAVQVQALRAVLGRSAIGTVPGRGYRFTLPVAEPARAPGVENTADGARPIPVPTPAPSALTNLPRRANVLYGRAQDSQTLAALLDAQDLVTVLGMGGVGKTQLAQHVASELLPRFAEGVWWVELASLSDPALVATTVARVLRTEVGPHRDAASAIVGTLRSGPALLVLDNAEHVVDGVRPLVATLLEKAPHVKLLVTSQVPLQLHGEQLMRLGALPVPPDDSLDAARHSAAVSLFEARARALNAGFRVDANVCAVVADICRQLDGIPLGIELAAARLPLLGLEGIRSRLNERFQFLTLQHRAALPRHQTLRAALDWSHALLEAQEQRLLRRLGVFCGGFTLEAAQHVALDPDMDRWAALESLGSLVDKSLVLAEGDPIPRYRLLETTRLYALERLAEAGEEALVRERHARALDQLLRVDREDARRWRTLPAPADVLVAEVDNARAALEWARLHADDDLAIGLAARTSHVFLTASLNAEYLERVLPLRERAQTVTSAELVGRYWSAVAVACSRNAHPAGLGAGLRAADIHRASGDLGRLYDALTWTIAIGSRHGQVEPMQALIEEAERLERPEWPAAARSSFQWAKYRWLQMQGRTEEALLCATAQAQLLEQDNNWRMHVAWGANVADCEIALGRLDAAATRASGALKALDELGIDENVVGHVMDCLMVALTLQGRHDEALDVGRRARRLLEREGDDLRLLDTLALLAAGSCRFADAARLAGHVDAVMARSGESRWPSVAARRAQLERSLESSLAPSDRQSHLLAGAAMSREEAFALALGGVPGHCH